MKQHKAVPCRVSVPSCCLLRDCWRLLRPIWLMLATLVQDKATGRGQRQPHQASTSVVFRKAVVCPRITVCYQGTATDWSNLKEKSHSGVDCEACCAVQVVQPTEQNKICTAVRATEQPLLSTNTKKMHRLTTGFVGLLWRFALWKRNKAPHKKTKNKPHWYFKCI